MWLLDQVSNRVKDLALEASSVDKNGINKICFLLLHVINSCAVVNGDSAKFNFVVFTTVRPHFNLKSTVTLRCEQCYHSLKFFIGPLPI